MTEANSLESIKENNKKTEDFPTAKFQKSMLLRLWNSRFYIRAAAVLVMITSLSLIVAAAVMFSKAKKQLIDPA
jgi:hypothetical protein